MRTAELRASSSRLRAVMVMLVAVGLQVAGAVLLKSMADARVERSLLLLALGLGAVLALNLVRLAVWGFAHRHFPLSTTYPLSSLFFPAMLIVAWAYGDPIGVSQVTGALLIGAGSFWLTARVRT